MASCLIGKRRNDVSVNTSNLPPVTIVFQKEKRSIGDVDDCMDYPTFRFLFQVTSLLCGRK